LFFVKQIHLIPATVGGRVGFPLVYIGWCSHGHALTTFTTHCGRVFRCLI